MTAADNSPTTLIDELLLDQQRLTAVEKFAHLHDTQRLPAQAANYRELIPLAQPTLGQQYAFEVDLDACSGCKACVTACHRMNGLDEGETWRAVGLLHGGTPQLPVLQHVTTACHHCIEPACLEGCPVAAYEKDELTGIVRHLDDQCIGCKYCIFKCPYDVPKYSHDRGIVRKCDMCRQRLEIDEAPACVQACPSQAIRITIVDQPSVVAESEANSFLPGAPEPSYTVPTTVYKTDRAWPRNMLPADYFVAQPQHAHWSLVFMLVLTQMSAGALAIGLLLARSPLNSVEMSAKAQAVNVIGAVALGVLGLFAAIFHLGRPQFAFRALIGLRTSWLSREILAFGLFPVTAGIYAATEYLRSTSETIGPGWVLLAGSVAAINGLVAVFCSAMIYIDTRRPFWNATFTSIRFFGSSIVLGLPVALMIGIVGLTLDGDRSLHEWMNVVGRPICLAITIATTSKLLLESLVFLSLYERNFTPLKRTAYLLANDLRAATLKRYVFGVLGGIAIPAIVLLEQSIGALEFRSEFLVLLVFLSALTLLFGELTERYLFFAAVVAPKMPGVTP